MHKDRDISVAILLATYNGSQYVAQQIESLSRNSTPITLHWIDDLSSDDTRSVVQNTVSRLGLLTKEWSSTKRQGCPGTFFFLLENVQADIYLFCDQDDIWEAGKIDATVVALTGELDSAAICFSDPLMFKNDAPHEMHRLSKVSGTNPLSSVRESRLFMAAVPHGNALGFTRALRHVYLRHSQIARSYAVMHDVWMYDIAVACGTVKFLSDVPTVLYRFHGNNVSAKYGRWVGKGPGRISMSWAAHQAVREGLARHARGFLLACRDMPRSEDRRAHV